MLWLEHQQWCPRDFRTSITTKLALLVGIVVWSIKEFHALCQLPLLVTHFPWHSI